MNYEMFVKMARLNSQFEVIPSNTSLFAEGVVIDNKGHIQHKGKTYITNMVRLVDLPEKLQLLFVESNNQLLPSPNTKGNITTAAVKDGLSSLSETLFNQLQNIVEPKAGSDIQQELKKQILYVISRINLSVLPICLLKQKSFGTKRKRDIDEIFRNSRKFFKGT